jgi:formamidopyrimidine-DNA glycosylase
MPELPEVETVRRGLHRLIIGKIIKSVSFDTPKSFPNVKTDVDSFLVNSEITDVRRRAKVLMIDLATNYTLVIHLKMTGQLVFVDNSSRFGAGHPNDSLVGSLPDKSTRVNIEFIDKSHLYFNDQRKFGWVRLMPTNEVPSIDFMKKVGPEPLEETFTVDEFIGRFKRRSRTTIKAALLDQAIIAGVGNIYADESLWGAEIHPSRTVGSITDVEFAKLYTEVRSVMNLSIEKGGSTNRNYVNAEGKKGSYMDFARVFRREGLACPRCGTEIIKIRVAGRGTHVCPVCQKV